MLNDLKETYKSKVRYFEQYSKLSQLELVEGYLKGGSDKDIYLSTLILRYWHIIDRALQRDKNLYDPLEAYNWYITAVMCAINTTPWKDKNTSLYNDSKAVERALNTYFNNERLNWFQASNRHKRKLNHNTASLETLQEDYKDTYMPVDYHQDLALKEYKYLVQDIFKQQKYLLALMIDVIIHDVTLTKCVDNHTLVNTIRKSIRSLPENYTTIFSSLYDIDKELVGKAFSFIYNMNDLKLKQSIESYVYQLRIILKNEVLNAN